MIYSGSYLSPLGTITMASDGECVVGLWFEGQKYFGGTVKGDMVERENLFVFGLVREWLEGYFAGDRPPVGGLPLAPFGGEFRKGVWEVLCEIPYGEVVSYGEIAGIMARRMGRQRMSAQAVGGAVGHNPVSVVIPCHRVVGSDGSLTGYAGGIGRKVRLLEHEGVDMSGLFVPRKGTAL